MLKNQLGKKVISFASALVMAASATVTGLSAASLTASAGEELGEGTFENGKGLPWHICENATAKMYFDITDGVYAIKLENIGGIENGGESRWDCQFRHRNLTIESGHTYRITYSVNPTNSGHMYAKLGNMNNDDQEMWHSNGTKLNMEYEEGLTQSELETKLKNATSTGTTVEYGQGWDAWYNFEYPANQWTCVAYEFTADQTVEGTAEWTFHMGGKNPSQYANIDCFPAGTIVRFDNLALIDMTNDTSDYVQEEDYEVTGVEVNQVGYYPNGKKVATLITSEGDTTQYEWALKNASGETVLSGTTDGSSVYDSDAGDYSQTIDFTDYTEEGKGYTLCVGDKKSIAFDIDKDLYANANDDSLLTYALNYFYVNRAMDTDKTAVAGGGTQQTDGDGSMNIARKDTNHWPTDTAYLANEWVYIYASNPVKSGTYTDSIDVSGGWFDAGDYGKYVLNGGISLWTLMNMYEVSIMNGTSDKFADGCDTMYLPSDEKGNGVPDILDECRVELEFFEKMICKSGTYEGMVYHKAHDYKWTGLAVAPYDTNKDDTHENKNPSRIVKPVTLAATLNASAAFAQAARLFEDYDATFAAQLKSEAISTYAAAQKHFKKFTGWMKTDGTVLDEDSEDARTASLSADLLYAPMTQDKGGGAYGDTEVSDEFYWAACELYITTGDKTYYDELMKYGTSDCEYLSQEKCAGEALGISTTLVGGENNNTFSLFTWGTVNSVGSISLYVNADEMLEKGLLTQAEVDKLREQVVSAADTILEVQNASQYGSPYKGHDYEASVWRYDADTETGSLNEETLSGGYEWGSNSMVINNTMAMALAYIATNEVEYIDGVTTSMDYLMGRNPLEQSYVTGYGEHSTKYPHHRWWSGQLDPEKFPYAPYGVLSGGPNSSMQDPMVQGMGYKIGEIAPMKCYLDNVEAWSVNECTINWNSPLCWVASFIDDEGPNIVRDGSTKPATTTTTGDASETTTTTTAATTTGNKADASVTPGDLLLGDVNLDGRVDITDAVMLNKAAAGSVSLNEQQKLNADCFDDGSGEINVSDATTLLKFLVHTVTALPETPES